MGLVSNFFMGLLQLITSKYNSSNEITAEKYFSEYLVPEDARHLKLFVSTFGNKLESQIPCAIIAVGSSVFPESHWHYRRELNTYNPKLKAAEAYQDIDLLVVPEKNTSLNDLETAVQETIINMQLYYKKHKDTSQGVAYFDAISMDDKGFENTVAPFRRYSYGLHSIETKLPNGSRVDLILGRKDLWAISAAQKIKLEKKSKNAFSIIYRK